MNYFDLFYEHQKKNCTITVHGLIYDKRQNNDGWGNPTDPLFSNVWNKLF